MFNFNLKKSYYRQTSLIVLDGTVKNLEINTESKKQIKKQWLGPPTHFNISMIFEIKMFKILVSDIKVTLHKY